MTKGSQIVSALDDSKGHHVKVLGVLDDSLHVDARYNHWIVFKGPAAEGSQDYVPDLLREECFKLCLDAPPAVDFEYSIAHVVCPPSEILCCRSQFDERKYLTLCQKAIAQVALQFLLLVAHTDAVLVRVQIHSAMPGIQQLRVSRHVHVVLVGFVGFFRTVTIGPAEHVFFLRAGTPSDATSETICVCKIQDGHLLAIQLCKQRGDA